MAECSIPAAVGRICGLVGRGDLSADGIAKLDEAFAVVDQSDCEKPEDVLALLSLSKLILKTLIDGQTRPIEEDGAAQLLVFAWSYLGRSIEKLELEAKIESLASGMREM